MIFQFYFLYLLGSLVLLRDLQVLKNVFLRNTLLYIVSSLNFFVQFFPNCSFFFTISVNFVILKTKFLFFVYILEICIQIIK